MGYAWRNNAQGVNVSFPVRSGGLAPANAWERLYVRVRAYPAGGQEDVFWFWFDNAEGTVAAHLHIDSNGFLKLYNQGAGSTTLRATSSSALTIGTWYRLDALIQFPIVTPGAGTFNLLANGASIMSVSIPTAVNCGFGLFGAKLATSAVGGLSGQTPHGAEIDLDDWTNADVPLLFTGLDWTNGSHLQLVRATGFGAGHSGNWVGDWHTLQVNPQPGEPATNVLVNASGTGAIVITTDYQDVQIGCVSLNVSYFQQSGGSVTGQIGYQVNGVPGLASLAVSNIAWANRAVNLGGVITPALLYPLNLEWVPVSVSNVQVLQATAEYLGAWGPEDSPPVPVVPHISGLHNAPYPTSAAAQAVTTPYAPVAVNAGSYTGNNLGQDVLDGVPAHWWWVRNVTSGNGGVVWWSSMEAAHGHTQSPTTANRVSRANGGPPPSMGVAGAAAESNATGSTYQWVAFSDPGMRFLLNGAFSHDSSLASAVNPFVDGTFLPDGMFFFVEFMDGTNTSQHWFKGPGHTTDRASLLSAADQSGVATFTTGSATSKSPLHTQSPQTAFSAWRKNDSVVSGAIDLVTWTGTGAGGTRNIACALNGNSPIFAIVTPHNAESWARDPSHLTTHSSSINTNTDSTTAIVGGDLNTVVVGTTLNATGIVYDMLVFAGVPTPGGWSGNPSTPIYSTLPIERPVSGGGGGPYSASPTPTPPPSPSSGYIPLSQALIEISVRLGDTSFVHWTIAEVQRYLLEALRTWNALTQTYRDQAPFSAASPTTFFDLPTVLPTLRGSILKDQDLVLDLEYALLEPPSATTWTGTAQFTLAQLTQAIQRRRDQFLLETGSVLSRETTAITSVVSGRLTMPKDIIELRRAAWITGGGVVVPLKREDEWALAKYRLGWQVATDPANTWPIVYSTAVEKPFVVQLAPPPNANGTLETIAVVVGAILNPATGVLLGISDDWAWAVKWGALGDLLSMPGPNMDPTRAAYCEARWQQAVRMCAKASVVLNSWIGGVQVRTASVVDADAYQRSWETTPGVPTQVLTMGQNLVALAPPPNVSGPYSVTLDVVRLAPMPVLVTDYFFEGGVSALEAIYNYAVHLAQFKEGPGQLQGSMDLMNQFFREAGVTIEIDLAQTPSRDAIMGQTNQDERVVPRLGTPGLQGADVAGTEPRN